MLNIYGNIKYNMNPVILAFNIRQSVYHTFGLTPYRHAVSLYGMKLLPIITTAEDGIQQRSKKLAKQLPKLLNKLNLDKAHFACYSTSGIDFRFAINQYGIGKYCKSLITISSPHQGSKLALLSDRKVFKSQDIQPISRLTGIGLHPFHQFTPENMTNFNLSVPNAADIAYYSLGSQRMPNLCSYSLKNTGKYLQYKTESNYVYHNDGVFGHDEIRWGNHIVNFEADHGEVIGITGDKQCDALKTINQIASNWEQQHSISAEHSDK